MQTLQTYRQHENGPATTIRIEPGAVVVKMEADVFPCWVPMHDHTFDHFLHVVSGRVHLALDGKTRSAKAGEKMLVEKHSRHSLVFAEPGTVAECRHENETIDPEKAFDGIPVEWVRSLTRAN